MKKFYGVCALIFSATGVFANIHVNNDSSKLSDDPRKLYLDLMKKTLVNTIYEDPSYSGPFDPATRNLGQDHPVKAFTMVGMKRLENIQYCLEDILEKNVPGDCVETGIWRGGCTILMRAILKAYNDTTRKVWAADSFVGVPVPNTEKYPEDVISPLHTWTHLAVSLDKVKKNFSKFDLLDKQVVFLEGFFSDTLPNAPIEKISLLRLDGDLYESTMDGLKNLYPKVSVGGYIIIDDYGSNPNCVQALLDYRKWNDITDPMIKIDYDAVYWQKTK